MNNTTLWSLGIESQEIASRIEALARRLESDDEDEHSRVIADLEALLLEEEGNKKALAAKADATCWVIDRLRGQAAYRLEQAARLESLADKDEAKANSLESKLIHILTRLSPDAKRFSLQNHEIMSRKSTRVNICDENLIPEIYVRYKTSSFVDKTSIKQAIKNGEHVPGATVTNQINWTIK